MFMTVLYIVGITSEAMTGALSAGRRKFDLFGVIMVAEVTALGGGTARDLVFGHYPLTWVRHPEYLILVGGAAILTVSIAKIMVYFRQLFLVLDAVGLATFSILGANVARDMGYGFILMLVAATITGVFGGIFRDVFCNRIPLVFQKELYAGTIPLGMLAYWLMLHYEVNQELTYVVSMLIVFITRLLAIRFGWGLPVFEYQEREYASSFRNQIWTWSKHSWDKSIQKIRSVAPHAKNKPPLASETKSVVECPDNPDSCGSAAASSEEPEDSSEAQQSRERGEQPEDTP